MQLDSAIEYAQRATVARKQGAYTVDALRAMVKHPSLFLDDWSGLSEEHNKSEAKKLYDSASQLLAQARSAEDQIKRCAKTLGKRPPDSNMTHWGKMLSAFLVGIGHCAYNAPNVRLRGYADELRAMLGKFTDDTEVNNAFAALTESSIDL